MQVTQQRNKKVIAFTQSMTTASKFRHNYPLTDEIRNELMAEVYNHFTDFVLREEFIASQPIIREYTEGFNLSDKKAYKLEFNLFWIKVLYSANCCGGLDYIDQFIDQNPQLTPLSSHWLREWGESTPSIYRIDFKLCQHVWMMKNLLTGEMVKIRIPDASTALYKSGGVILGTLIPIGDRIYFPIADFYHFNYSNRRSIIKFLKEKEHLLEGPYFFESFILLLSEILRLEQKEVYEKSQTAVLY